MNCLHAHSYEWKDIPGSRETGSGKSTSSDKLLDGWEGALSTWLLTSRSGMAFIRLAWVCWRILSISLSASGPIEWTLSSSTARFETCGEPDRGYCLLETVLGKGTVSLTIPQWNYSATVSYSYREFHVTTEKFPMQIPLIFRLVTLIHHANPQKATLYTSIFGGGSLHSF